MQEAFLTPGNALHSAWGRPEGRTVPCSAFEAVFFCGMALAVLLGLSRLRKTFRNLQEAFLTPETVPYPA